MNSTLRYIAILGGAMLLFTMSCGGDDSPVSQGNPQPQPSYLPAVPVPSSVDDPLPAASDYADVGLSSPLQNFQPMVARLCQMKDDATMQWSDQNRRLHLACDGMLAHAMCDPASAQSCYITDSPRLLHQRYWKRLKHVVMDPGTDYSHAETITYGSSTTNSVSQSFSETIGVETTASGSWGAFSAEVKASYSQTRTREEVNSVTFSEESSFTDTYSVTSDPSKTIVYGLWQLVDVFVQTVANTTPIDQSQTLAYVEIPVIAAIEFANRDVIRQSVTRFDPAP